MIAWVYAILVMTPHANGSGFDHAVYTAMYRTEAACKAAAFDEVAALKRANPRAYVSAGDPGCTRETTP